MKGLISKLRKQSFYVNCILHKEPVTHFIVVIGKCVFKVVLSLLSLLVNM